MIRSLYRKPDGSFQVDLDQKAFDPALKDPQGLLWIDFHAEGAEISRPILRDTFGFHPLAVDDALLNAHAPEVDDWGEYLCLVVYALELKRAPEVNLDTLELDIFLGHNYLVTLHEQPITALDDVWSTCQRDEHYLEAGPDHLLYQLLDRLAIGYLLVADELDEAVSALEDQLFSNPSENTLEQLFALKRAALRIRRILSPQREVLNKLARDSFAVIDAKDRVFFRAVYNHLVRLNDINESLRDLVAGALDTYLSVVNNRMNDAIKTLAVITTLFLPITFVTGFFGMNFFGPVIRLERLSSFEALALSLIAMIVPPVGLYLWVRRRGWL